ncbi:MAG TPA: hypothetical protein VHT75_11160 [Acidimicrobiales bacterium]|nr:hypothetical protein [Acidimicrobiales bacterium]
MHARRSTLPALSALSLATAFLAGCSHRSAPPQGLPCHAVAATGNFALDTDQSANAATIAAVGKRLGLPDHAVTVALAAALQESKLYNLPYGDLDSLGLFQQRPSQGWGTKDQILNPRYAAAAFYQHLATVANWQTLSVTDAAQAVQHSGAPDAYAQWETEARTVAQALTGEVAAGFTCRTVNPASKAPPVTVLATDLSAEIGSPALGVPLDTARGWLVAGWLIAHAGQYGVTTVTFAGQRWSGHTGTWTAQPPPTNTVQVNR